VSGATRWGEAKGVGRHKGGGGQCEAHASTLGVLEGPSFPGRASGGFPFRTRIKSSSSSSMLVCSPPAIEREEKKTHHQFDLKNPPPLFLCSPSFSAALKMMGR